MSGKKKTRFWLILAGLVLLFCGIGVKLFGNWGAQQLQCNHLQLPAAALPGAGPLKIAFFADLHNNRKLADQVIDHIAAARPDLIIFGGDFVMVSERFMRTRWAINALKRLRSIAPTYAILGNQDYEKLEQVERVYAAAGIPLLRNQATDWRTPAGSTLRIVGLGDWNEGDEAPATCMSAAGLEQPPVLLLSHDPESRWLLRGYDWDLMLSGHTHGGQAGNPFTGELLCFRSSMPAGLFPFEGNRRVFVTRGVGAIFGMRFFCPPEVNIIEVNGK